MSKWRTLHQVWKIKCNYNSGAYELYRFPLEGKSGFRYIGELTVEEAEEILEGSLRVNESRILQMEIRVKVREVEEKEKCEKCSGTGAVVCRDTQCPWCNGKGYKKPEPIDREVEERVIWLENRVLGFHANVMESQISRLQANDKDLEERLKILEIIQTGDLSRYKEAHEKEHAILDEDTKSLEERLDKVTPLFIKHRENIGKLKEDVVLLQNQYRIHSEVLHPRLESDIDRLKKDVKGLVGWATAIAKLEEEVILLQNLRKIHEETKHQTLENKIVKLQGAMGEIVKWLKDYKTTNIAEVAKALKRLGFE